MVLRHDLHKLKLSNAVDHQHAMPDDLARKGDGVAAWMSRHSHKVKFEKTHYRSSLVFPVRNLNNPRRLISEHRQEMEVLFQEADPYQLQAAILHSKLLNFYNEAREFPLTSLKYHILLTCSLYYNLRNHINWTDLYFCENLPVQSPFQVIYQDSRRTWALIPHQKDRGLARVGARFHRMWDRRRKLSIGGDLQALDGILSNIGSWTVALTTLEDFLDFHGLQ